MGRKSNKGKGGRPTSGLLKKIETAFDMGLLDILQTHFRGSIGREEIANSLVRMMAEKGITIKISQSTVWYWVKMAHKFNAFTPEQWDFHGKRKGGESRRHEPRIIIPEEEIDLSFSCLECKYSFQEKRSLNDLGNIGLRILKCPGCGQFGKNIVTATINGISFKKGVILKEEITLEAFVDDDMNQVRNPFQKKRGRKPKDASFSDQIEDPEVSDDPPESPQVPEQPVLA